MIWKSKSANREQPPALAPDGMRLYAVGDVHGRADLLRQVFSRIDKHRAEFPMSQTVEIFLGDYVDRGPSSREVIEELIARRARTDTVCLKGNHEVYALEFLKTPDLLDDWRHYGGLNTLLSYGLKPTGAPSRTERADLAAAFARALPDSHRQFLEALQLSYTCGDYFFVHAGVRPGIPLAEQREDDLLWIREDFIFYERNFDDKIIVHGHTPVLEPEVRSNRINIDTGAYATGRLTCLMIEADRMAFI